MKTKKCGRCKEELDIDKFKTHPSKGYQNYCIECHKEYRKEHYEKNRQKYIDKASYWRNEIVVWFQEFKSTLKCELCPETHPACLQFHHTDDNKEDNVATLVRIGNKKRILDEVAKCQVLCGNCHAKLHYNLRNNVGVA